MKLKLTVQGCSYMGHETMDGSWFGLSAFTTRLEHGSACADEPHWMDVLVDILLSLLGRSGDALPFGPLREACEAVFRAFAEQVTSQGFADLVRVVQQPPEGQADEEEDEDVFEDDDEDTLAGKHVHESSRGSSCTFSGEVMTLDVWGVHAQSSPLELSVLATAR